MKRFLWLFVLFLTACETSISITVSPSLKITEEVTSNPTSTIEIYKIGEPVSILISDMVYVCRYFYDEVPFTIVQVTDTGQREVALRHSCTGFIGQGVDEYCENGEIINKAVEIGKCSDDVFCDAITYNESFTWNQKEFVSVVEECEGKMIQREVEQQVPEGRYMVLVKLKTENEEIMTRVIKEFVIIK